jgi:hypothetical protein
MQETATARSCPVCGAALEPIQVLEKGHMDRQHRELPYAAGDTQPRRLMGMEISGAVAPEGSLRAWAGTACARVQFYAVPDTEPGEVSPAVRPEGRGDEPTATG